MIIVAKRILQRPDCTIGCVQVVLSGSYQSKHLSGYELKPYPLGGLWTTVCETLEPKAVPWVARPEYGEKPPNRITRNLAIPEGSYPIELRFSKKYKCEMPFVSGISHFESITIRTSRSIQLGTNDLLVGHLLPVPGGHRTDNPRFDGSRLAFKLLCRLIKEAEEHGEKTSLVVRSWRGWSVCN